MHSNSNSSGERSVRYSRSASAIAVAASLIAASARADGFGSESRRWGEGIERYCQGKAFRLIGTTSTLLVLVEQYLAHSSINRRRFGRHDDTPPPPCRRRCERVPSPLPLWDNWSVRPPNRETSIGTRER